MECLSEIEYKATTDILSTEWYSGRFSDICKFSQPVNHVFGTF